MAKTSVAQLNTAVLGVLADFKDVTNDVVEQAVKETAVETAKKISQNAAAQFPEGTGDYAKSWSQKTVNGRKYGRYTRIVYSRDPYYRLAHLLENGHAKVNGGRVEGRPHIAPAADAAADKLLTRIKSGVKNMEV